VGDEKIDLTLQTKRFSVVFYCLRKILKAQLVWVPQLYPTLIPGLSYSYYPVKLFSQIIITQKQERASHIVCIHNALDLTVIVITKYFGETLLIFCLPK